MPHRRRQKNRYNLAVIERLFTRPKVVILAIKFYASNFSKQEFGCDLIGHVLPRRRLFFSQTVDLHMRFFSCHN